MRACVCVFVSAGVSVKECDGVWGVYVRVRVWCECACVSVSGEGRTNPNHTSCYVTRLLHRGMCECVRACACVSVHRCARVRICFVRVRVDVSHTFIHIII